MDLSIPVSFTKNHNVPATGLTLSDIDLYLGVIDGGSFTPIWNGSQHPTLEVPDLGIYWVTVSLAYTGGTVILGAHYDGAEELDYYWVKGGVDLADTNDLQTVKTRVIKALPDKLPSTDGGLPVQDYDQDSGRTFLKGIATLVSGYTSDQIHNSYFYAFDTTAAMIGQTLLTELYGSDDMTHYAGSLAVGISGYPYRIVSATAHTITLDRALGPADGESPLTIIPESPAVLNGAYDAAKTAAQPDDMADALSEYGVATSEGVQEMLDEIPAPIIWEQVIIGLTGYGAAKTTDVTDLGSTLNETLADLDTLIDTLQTAVDDVPTSEEVQQMFDDIPAPIIWEQVVLGLSAYDAATKADVTDITSNLSLALEALDSLLTDIQEHQDADALVLVDIVEDTNELQADWAEGGTLREDLQASAGRTDPLWTRLGDYPDYTSGWALNRLISGAVILADPYLPNYGKVIVYGDDYLTEDNQQFTWANTPNDWPDLAGATIVMQVSTILTTACVAVKASGTMKVVTCDVTSEQTSLFEKGRVYYFNVVATLATGHISTIVKRARLHVVDAL